MDGFFDLVFLTNTVRQWFISAAFILGGLGAGKVCSFIMRGILRHICRKTSTDIDDILIGVLEKPLGITVSLVGATIGIKELKFHEQVDKWINRGLESAFIVIVAWAVYRIFDAMILRLVPIRGLGQADGRETDIRPLLRKFFKTVIALIAAALILRVMGYNVSALMAGLGLGGAALALASKDTLSNFFGSITVFVDRPFKLNDRIKIGAYDGIITEMGVRTSRLRTVENRIVVIPNSIFANTPIENISAVPHTKVIQTLNLKGENGPDKIEEALDILRDICSTQPGLDDVPLVNLLSVGAGICQVSLTYFVSRQADYEKTVCTVNLTILRRLAEAGISLG
ncbi:MAG: mechanosensitive ion channel family protein [Treponema sp.]|jgi:MscS family membrane protein|nr:mechanosensitive ion channel family protein [Treponema sp.]